MNLHERIADKLGWTVEDTRTFSLPALRELVWPVSLKLADEVTLVMRSPIYIRHEYSKGTK